MALLSFTELFDIVVMSFVVGFIFKDVFAPKRNALDPDSLLKNVTPGSGGHKRGLDSLNAFWYVVLLVSPAIIFHEFGHKFVAMSFGLTATFHAAYIWLLVGVVLKIFMPGFIFFIPAYVSYPGMATPIQQSLIAFAGPGVNLFFWLCTAAYLKWTTKRLSREKLRFLVLFRRINMFLFILNMIPIPPFDGYHVFASLAAALF